MYIYIHDIYIYIYICIGHGPGVTCPEATYEKLMTKLCDAALSANPASYSAQSVANLANALVFFFFQAQSVANIANSRVFRV
jgi:hypothetical protein